MNAQTGSGLHRKANVRHRRVAAFVLGVWCAGTTVVLAQTETPESAPVAVETYYGLKRVQATRPVRTIDESTTCPAPLPSLENAPIAETPRMFSGPLSPDAIVPQASDPAPAIVPALHETIGPDSALDEARRLPPRTEVPDLEPVPQHEPMPSETADTPKLSEELPGPRPSESSAPANANAGESRGAFVALTSTQTPLLVGAFIASATVLLLAAVYAMRRFGLKNRFRVEPILAPGWKNHPAAIAVSPPHSLSGSQAATVAEENPPFKNFDMGPTFEEERQMREAEGTRRESALLRHICDQNVLLQTEVAGQRTGDGTQTVEDRKPVAVSRAN